MPPDTPSPADTDRLFETFRATRSSQEMLMLAAAVPDADLDALEAVVESRLTAAEGDEAAALRQRLDSLRRLRAEQAETIQQMRDMSPDERLLLAFTSARSTADIMRLVAGTPDDDLDRLEAAAGEKLAAVAGDERNALQQRLDDLRRWRAAERDARRVLAALGDEGSRALADRLVAWIRTPDWAASEAFLREHAADLLSDAGAAAMTLLHMRNAGDETVEIHARLLAACREHGIEAAYAQLRREQAMQRRLEQLAASPLGQAVMAFINADDAAAAALLASRDLLTSADARDALELLREAARQQGDAAAVERIAARLALVQAARLARYAPPHVPGTSEVPGTWGRETGQLQTLEGRIEGVKYLVLSAGNCAIGDNAITINNFGVVPLQWRKPQEFQRNLTERAVGRREELADLRRALENGSAAVVGKGVMRERGTSGALLGEPGVGKSTLAALYAEAYADDYPGGVLWLQLTPDMTTPESVGPELSRIAAYAYNLDLQAWRMFVAAQQLPGADPLAVLKQAQLTPEIVRGLLSGHGRLLVVADNVWEPAIVEPIRKALPIDAHLLVTTRDERVAIAVGRRMALDVLTEADALALIAQILPDLPPDLAERLSRAVGRHPLALEITAGDLAVHGPDEWAGLVARIEADIRQGLSLDGVPLPDDIARERRLEAVLRYSYDALGRAPDGPALQRRFRALGCLAFEADFAADAAAALWEEDPETARTHLDIFAARSLLRRRPNGRWQQHGILRGFALRLQSAAERERWPERHARHYLAAMQAADAAGRYYTMAPDLPNLRAAFAWAAQESLELAQSLLSACADLLRSQNLGAEYLAWAERVLARARQAGSPADIGAALLSHGNALQAAATVVIGEDRGARLRQALAAYDEALAKLRDVPLDYAQTQNNRAVLLSDLASLPGEDRGARLRQALAAYDEALALRRDVPLAYAQTQNNRALLLHDLASLPGEDRGVRLRQALAAYDEALALRRDVPLDYAQTQNNRAVLLRDLASLPGEDRGARLRQALAAAADAVRLFEAYQHVQYLEIGRSVLASVVVALGAGEFAAAWPDLFPDTDPPRLTPQELLLALAQAEDIASNEAFMERIQADPRFRARVGELIALAQGSQPDAAADDPLAAGLAALLAADSDQALAQALSDHPILAEPQALFALAGLVDQALQAQQGEAVARLTALLVALLYSYNRAHAEQIDVAAHAAVIDLCERLIPLAGQIHADLATAVRQQAGWACNTLGNHYADQVKDLEQAVAAYTRGLGFDPTNAMLLRNRAGVHLDRRDWAAAKADIEAATALEPGALRLTELSDRLQEMRGGQDA